MKGAIFDLDGTLMDSMGSWSKMWEDMLADYHLPRPERFTQDITPLGAVGTAEYLQKLGLHKELHEIVEMFERRILHAYTYDILPKPFVPEYLDKLRAEGVTLCILTASPQMIVQPCLKRTGLWDKFAFACSCDDVAMAKSNPAIYPLTAQRLGLPLSDIVFFDDNLEALTAAHQAGLYTVGVYDDTSAADRPRIEAVTDRYITSFSALL